MYRETIKGAYHPFTRQLEITTLLSNVDRENPAGKRDYAILLFAIRYGMRVGDDPGPAAVRH